MWKCDLCNQHTFEEASSACGSPGVGTKPKFQNLSHKKKHYVTNEAQVSVIYMYIDTIVRASSLAARSAARLTPRASINANVSSACPSGV